ncbi:hypothetical protein BN946_scf184940.g12 [Trametes cinnabarina]|uniref:Uncharacterized protein n=1 Tax=Pycnoporus cinnabarinus TaxID=5643 RepID=A0A060SBZ3_PYCCI|nr:hypothetical protein BN946_scf184940.g12 [Trametes cinnabarina]
MKFFSLLPAIAVAALGAVSVVAQDAKSIVMGVESVTTLSDSARKTTVSLSVGNAVSEFPVIVKDINKIVSTVGQLTTTIQKGSGKPLPEQGAKDVVAALTTFVKVHQALLNAIIGKHSLASKFVFTAPIAAALRAIEAGVDTFAFALIDLIPTGEETTAANKQFASLQVTIKAAVKEYK